MIIMFIIVITIIMNWTSLFNYAYPWIISVLYTTQQNDWLWYMYFDTYIFQTGKSKHKALWRSKFEFWIEKQNHEIM